MPRLTLADLGGFDPQAPPPRAGEQRFCCPLDACAEKPRDAAHRTLCVNVATGMWTCQRCHASGQLEESREPPSRAARDRRLLREAFHVPPPAPPPAPADLSWRAALKGMQPLVGNAGASYLGQRRIAAAATAAGVKFSADWYGRPAVVFPIRDRAGTLVAAQGRYLDAGKPKTRDAGPKGAGVFATRGAWEADPIVLVEGPADALSLATAGYPAIALMGCSASDVVAWSCALRAVAVALDADEAGDAASAKLMAALAARGCLAIRLRPKDGQDWNDMLLELGAEALGAELKAALAIPPEPPQNATEADSSAVCAPDSVSGHPATEIASETAPEEKAAEEEAWRQLAAVLPDGDLIAWVREKWGCVLMLDGAGRMKAVGAAAVPEGVREEVRSRARFLTLYLKRRVDRGAP